VLVARLLVGLLLLVASIAQPASAQETAETAPAAVEDMQPEEPAAEPTSPSPFGGNPEDVTVRPADLGAGW
jgi:hypothetical protein